MTPNPAEARVAALHQLAGLVGSASDVPTLAAALDGFLCTLFGCAAASLVLVDARSDELVFHTASAATGRLLNRARLRRGQGIAGWVAERLRPANVADARRDPRFCDYLDQQTGFFTRSVLCVPLHRQGQVTGALEVINRNDGEPFDDDDLSLLTLIADHVALLAANAVLISGLEKRNRELSALLEVDRAMIAENDVHKLIGVILRSLAQVTRSEGSSVVLVDESIDGLRFFQAVGPARDRLMDIQLDRGAGIVGECIATGQRIWVPEPYADSRFQRQVDESTGFVTRSILCVPLRRAGQVIGAVELVNLPDVPDIEEVLDLVEAFAGMAAQALERARVFQGLTIRADQTAEQLERTVRALGEEKAKLTAMIGKMADAVIMVDTDGRLLMLNPAASAMFGVTDDLVGRSALTVGNVGLAAVLGVGDTGPEGHELTFVEPERRVLRVQSATVAGGDGERVGHVVVCSDITELQELARARSDLVWFVSHELRLPLTTMKGFASTLLGDSRITAPELRDAARFIDLSVDRARRLADDMLCAARLDSGQQLYMNWRRFDLCEVVGGLLDAAKLQDPRWRYVWDRPAEPLIVEADLDKIEQILANLLSNATKYSLPKTRVGVSTRLDGDEVVVDVADEGFGIAPDDLPRLFRQFSRLADARRREIPGTGLGLFLCRQLIEAHGGRIEVTSDVGRGSTFSFRWPRRRAWEGD